MANIFDFSKREAARILREFSHWGEAWILPPLCVHCGRRRYAGLPLCRNCLRLIRANLVWDEEVFPQPWIHPLFCMTPPLLSLIHGFKYRHYRRHIDFLCAYLRYRPVFAEALKRPEIMIPVPLHAARYRERGYNQSEAIAKAVGHRFDLPWSRNAMQRIRFTDTQTRLGIEGRAINLENTFRCDPRTIFGKKVLLVDDVCTTGNTLVHCRDELLRAGLLRSRHSFWSWVARYQGVLG